MEVTPLSEETLFRKWLDRMPESRKQKVTAMRHAESQRLSLGVGILLFQALEKRGLDSGGEAILADSYGRPYLPNHPEICFSLSHAGVWAMCAVSDHPVGCDVEKLGRETGRIARRFFHPEECAALDREKDPAARDRLFTRLWTRKESYLKAIGTGFHTPLSSFSVLSSEKNIRYDERDIAAGYIFTCCMLDGGREEPSWSTVFPEFPEERTDR